MQAGPGHFLKAVPRGEAGPQMELEGVIQELGTMQYKGVGSIGAHLLAYRMACTTDAFLKPKAFRGGLLVLSLKVMLIRAQIPP